MQPPLSPCGPLPYRTLLRVVQKHFSILPPPSPGQTLDLPHTLPAEPSPLPPCPDTTSKRQQCCSPSVGPSWALVEGLQQPPPGHYGYAHACGHTLQQTLGAVGSTALLPVQLRGREAGDAVTRVVYISLVV